MPRSGRVVSRCGWIGEARPESGIVWGAVSTPRERRVYNGAPWSCGRAKATGREVEPEAVVATVAARSAGHYFIHALYYFILH